MLRCIYARELDASFGWLCDRTNGASPSSVVDHKVRRNAHAYTQPVPLLFPPSVGIVFLSRCAIAGSSNVHFVPAQQLVDVPSHRYCRRSDRGPLPKRVLRGLRLAVLLPKVPYGV